MKDRNIVIEKELVIVQKGNYFKACRISTNRPQKFGKKGESQVEIDLGNGIGHQFGTIFKLVRGNRKALSLELHDDCSEGIDLDVESGIDNRNIFDDGQSQSLSKSDIKQLVDSGISGDEVIQTLTQNSKTFKSKTKYSQEKYVSKKLRKYDELVTLHRPSIRLLMHMHYSQDPLKISNLRIDTLSQMMAYVNVQPGGNYAVYEAGMQGLITASLLSYTGSTGSLVHIYSGNFPHKEAVELMGFTTEELVTLSFIGADNLPVVNEGSECDKETNGFETTQNDTMIENEIEMKMDEDLEEKLEETDDSSETLNDRKFIRCRKEDIEISTKILRCGVHGLIVACKQHPSAITMGLLPYLIPGHSFAVYSPYKEVLMELFVELKAESCLNIRLVENWLRNYQVLPQRTHPAVNMSGGGGYILTGWKAEK